MSAGRKWMVAVVVALVGVLALYYGVFSGPGADPAAEAEMLAADPTLVDDPTLAANDEEAMEQARPRQPTLTDAGKRDAGFLTDTMNGANGAATTTNRDANGLSPLSTIGPDGKVRPVTIAHDPNNSLVRDLSNSNTRRVVTPDPGKGDVVVPPDQRGPPINDPLRSASQPQANANTPASATPAIAPTTLAPKYETYIVKDGDTMSSIAASWFGDGKKWDLIAKANPLVDPRKMQVGQKLNMPAKTAEREKPKPGTREYTVRPGDTLVDIARAIYGDRARWKAIYEANKSSIGSDPDNIREGLKLTIPDASRS